MTEAEDELDEVMRDTSSLRLTNELPLPRSLGDTCLFIPNPTVLVTFELLQPYQMEPAAGRKALFLPEVSEDSELQKPWQSRLVHSRGTAWLTLVTLQ